MTEATRLKSEAIALDLQDVTRILTNTGTNFAQFLLGVEKGDVKTQELAVAFWTIKKLHKEADEALTAISSKLEKINKGILPKMLHDADMDMIRVPSIGYSFSVRTNYSATMLDKEKAMEWLRETGNEALIQPTVNSGTLASFCRAMIVDEGKEPPADLIKVTTYDSIGMAKYTPKPGTGGDE